MNVSLDEKALILRENGWGTQVSPRQTNKNLDEVLK